MFAKSSVSTFAQRFLTLIVIGAILLLTATTAFGQARPDYPDSDRPDITDPVQEYIAGELVVKLSPDADPDQLMSSLFNYSLVTTLEHSSVYLFTADKGYSPSVTQEVLTSVAGVEWVQPNYMINRLHAVQGSYPFSDVQRVGDIATQPAVDMLEIDQSHLYASGSGVKVAVIDCGIDIGHPALEGKAVNGWNFIANDADATDIPDGLVSGHGTFVAGLIHLVAPNAQIRAYKVINENGYGDGFTLARAIERAVDDGCQIINISLVLYNQHLAVTEAVNYAHSMGVTVVTAAGNNGTDNLTYPAADQFTIGVAGINKFMKAEEYSNFGSYVDVCAPAHMTYSTYQHDGYAWWSGTSFATPFVTGQAALLAQLLPLASPDEIMVGIKGSAYNLDDTNPDLIGKLGTGLIKPLNALSPLGETAQLIPDTLHFTHYAGAMYIVLPGAATLLTSSNAPAVWHSEVIGEPDFHIYLDTAGYTGDSLWILVDPWMTSIGQHFGTVRFEVSGVAEPVDLTIELTVQPDPEGEDYALLTPSILRFSADLGSESVSQGSTFLFSSNAPANYTARVVGGTGFTTLVDQSGLTNDTVMISVDPTGLTTVGTYLDTIQYDVEGIENSPILFVELQITDPNQPSDTGTVWPHMRSYYSPTGVLTEGTSAFVVSSFASNHPYTVSFAGTNDFVTLTNSSGITNIDQIAFSYTTPDTQTPHFYADTLIIDVEGIVNSPLIAVVTLDVYEDTVVFGTGSAWPYSQFFTIDGNTPFDIDGAVFLNYTGGQTSYTATTARGTSWLQLDQPTGLTGDSVWFSVVDPVGLDSGIYIDTILFTIDGASNNPVRSIVFLAVGGAGSGYPVPSVSPIAQAFYQAAYAPFSESGSVSVTATKEPTPFTVEVVGNNKFTQLVTTSGTTDQLAYFNIVSAAGMAPGIYGDTLKFTFPNASPTTKMAYIYIQVTDTSGMYSCCESVGDVNGDGNPYTFIDTLTLAAILRNDPGIIETVPCLGNADIDQNCLIDQNDMVHLKEILAGSRQPFATCGSCSDYTVVFDSISCCTMAGDLNGNGIYMEWVDTIPLAQALTTGDPSYIDCIQTADINHDCVVDINDLGLLKLIIMGDTLGYPDCGYCTSYSFVPNSGGTVTDSAWLSPSFMSFSIPYQSLGMYGAMLGVNSTNAPADYVAFVLDGPGSDPNSFVGIPDSLGTTNDSTFIGVSADGLAIGTYVDTVVVDVAGITESEICIVTLYVTMDSVSANNDLGTDLANHPNPFNPTTVISYSLANAGSVELKVFNVLGQEVRTLVDGYMSAGPHQIEWNGTNGDGQRVASGVYLYRLKTTDASITKKMLMLK